MDNSDNDKYIIEEVTDQTKTLSNLASLGQEFLRLNNEVANLESLLGQRKKQLQHISSIDIPDAMATIGMAEFRLTNGYLLRVKHIMTCKLPKDKVDEAEKWLDENGHTGMVKRHIEVTIPKNTDPSITMQIMHFIKQKGFDVTDTKSIHYQTLQKWAREMEEEGANIPETIFEVNYVSITEIRE